MSNYLCINTQVLASPIQPDVSLCTDLAGFASNCYCYLDSLSKAQPFWQAPHYCKHRMHFICLHTDCASQCKMTLKLQRAWGTDPAAWPTIYVRCVQNARKIKEYRGPFPLNDSEHYPLCFLGPDSTEIFI